MLTITELVSKVAHACRYYTTGQTGFEYFVTKMKCYHVDIKYNTVSDVFYFIHIDKCLSFLISENQHGTAQI